MNQLIQSKQWSPSIWNGMSPRWNRIWDDFDRFASLSPRINTYLPLDIQETDSEYRVTTDMPGMSKENIDISIKDSVLTISAEKSSEATEQSDGRVIRRERLHGKFARSLRLSDLVDEEKIEATYKDGVLHVVLPKVEVEQPKKVEIAIN